MRILLNLTSYIYELCRLKQSICKIIGIPLKILLKVAQYLYKKTIVIDIAKLLLIKY